MQVTTKISIDLSRPNIGACIHAVQGDGNTRLAEITLLSGGLAWSPPGGVEAAIAYKQPGGTKGLYNKLADGTAAISISGNVATVTLAPQMLTVSGTVQASLVFNDQQLNRLTTFPFSVSVASNPAAWAQKVEDYIRLQWLEDKLAEYLRKAAESGEFDGNPGDPGTTFTPSVAENGDLSWSNDGGRPNPPTVNIMGPKPINGVDYGTPEQIAGIANQAAEILQPEVSQIKNDLSDLAPAGAVVGQLFRVAAISEDGKYTMEPVDVVTGVTINGNQLAKDANGNAKFTASNGLAYYNGVIYPTIAGDSHIDIRNSESAKYRLLQAYGFDYAVKAAMCDGKGAAWTAEEQAAACDRVGAIRSYGDGWILKARWQNSDPITVDFSGCSEFFIAGYINATGESDLFTNINSNKICYQFVRNGERNIRMLFCNQPIGGIMPLLGKWSSSAEIQGDNLSVYSVGKIGSTKKISDITTFSISKPGVVTSMDIYVYAR